MKVLQVHNLQSAYGGADEVIRLESAALRSKAIDVELYTVSTTEALDAHGRTSVALRSVVNRTAYQELLQRIRDFQPDVVHFHTPFPLLSLAAFRAAYVEGVASVVTCHSFRFSCIAGNLLRDGQSCSLCVGKKLKWPGIVHRCYRDSVSGSAALVAGIGLHRTVWSYQDWINRFVVMTPFARDVLAKDVGNAERIVVKPNFSEDLGFVRQPNVDRGSVGLRFVFAGRLEPEKGIKTLMEAWRQRSAQGAESQLVVAGDGSLRAEVEELVRKDRTVRYEGFLSRKEMRVLLQSADCVLFPSEWPEAGPTLAMMEAFSVGAPILAADEPNFASAISQGQNGWVFQGGSTADLARALSSVEALGSDNLAKLRVASRRTFDGRFSEAVVVPKLIAIYEEALTQAAFSNHTSSGTKVRLAERAEG